MTLALYTLRDGNVEVAHVAAPEDDVRPALEQLRAIRGLTVGGDHEWFARSPTDLRCLGDMALSLRRSPLPECPACLAEAGDVCLPSGRGRRRNGVHPARLPQPASAPVGRPRSVAWRSTIELDADELARVDARRGALTRTGYLRSRIETDEAKTKGEA